MSELRSQCTYETSTPTWGMALALVSIFIGPSGQQCHVVSTHGRRPLVG